MVTAGCNFLPKGTNFYADSVRACVFQQLLCITYALTPSGSKDMIHGVVNPQYQGYRKKSL